MGGTKVAVTTIRHARGHSDEWRGKDDPRVSSDEQDASVRLVRVLAEDSKGVENGDQAFRFALEEDKSELTPLKMSAAAAGRWVSLYDFGDLERLVTVIGVTGTMCPVSLRAISEGLMTDWKLLTAAKRRRVPRFAGRRC